jgi:hypothetical protein
VSDSSDQAPTEEPAPRKRRRKRSTKRQRQGPALDAQGRERPPFLRELPDDPDLNLIVRAYERGDYRLVRYESERLAEESVRPEVRRAARELRRRIDPDPLAKYLLLVACGLFAFLVFWTYFIHAH